MTLEKADYCDFSQRVKAGFIETSCGEWVNSANIDVFTICEHSNVVEIRVFSNAYDTSYIIELFKTHKEAELNLIQLLNTLDKRN